MTRNHDRKDSRAIHGYQPTWDKQREKQDEAAANFYGESDEQALENAKEELNDED